MTAEINAGRPFVWSPAGADSAHSVPAWGYRDDKYIILYDTWSPGGREDWYYSYYLGNSSDPMTYVQVERVWPGGGSDSEVSLDEPNGGESALANHPYTVWWYQWGTSIDNADMYYSTNDGGSWNVLATWVTSVEGWNSYAWFVPNVSSTTARVRIEGWKGADTLLSADGSLANFTISMPTCSSLTYPTDKWQRVWRSYNGSYCLGNGPDETSLQFNSDWAEGTVAHGRNDDIQFTSGRSINFSAGTYRFTVGSDDGLRLWIDGVLKVDQWIDRAYTTNTVDVALTAGYHNVRLDYYENAWGARVYFTYALLDTTPPDTTIVTKPNNPINSTAATFSFTSTEANSTFSCCMAKSGNLCGYFACTSPKTYTGLTEGTYWITVRATDQAGNTDPSPASYSWIVDLTPPDTTITAKPGNPSNSMTAAFSFTSTEANSTFQCKLDAGAYSACVSPKTYTGLSGGVHSFWVKAADQAGNIDPSSTLWSWTVDVTAPNTTITAKPDNPTTSTSAAFSFTSTEASSTFQCSIDSGAYSVCTSPKTYTGLPAGGHTFSVKATDQAGNTDSTPASYSWTIDLTPPNTSFISKPAKFTKNTTAEFAFTSSESGSTFKCLLDGSAFSACTTPKTYTGLAEGVHTFKVKAIDNVGNVDSTAAAYSWTVDLTPPNTAITGKPSNPTSSKAATFTFTSTEVGSIFKCKLDGNAYSTCITPKSYTGLAAGTHTFYVKAVDKAKNTDVTPASYSWKINP